MELLGFWAFVVLQGFIDPENFQGFIGPGNPHSMQHLAVGLVAVLVALALTAVPVLHRIMHSPEATFGRFAVPLLAKVSDPDAAGRPRPRAPTA